MTTTTTRELAAGLRRYAEAVRVLIRHARHSEDGHRALREFDAARAEGIELVRVADAIESLVDPKVVAEHVRRAKAGGAEQEAKLATLLDAIAHPGTCTIGDIFDVVSDQAVAGSKAAQSLVEFLHLANDEDAMQTDVVAARLKVTCSRDGFVVQDEPAASTDDQVGGGPNGGGGSISTDDDSPKGGGR